MPGFQPMAGIRCGAELEHEVGHVGENRRRLHDPVFGVHAVAAFDVEGK